MFYLFTNSIDCKSLRMVEGNLKIISNLIQIINEYDVKKKHDLTK